MREQAVLSEYCDCLDETHNKQFIGVDDSESHGEFHELFEAPQPCPDSPIPVDDFWPINPKPIKTNTNEYKIINLINRYREGDFVATSRRPVDVAIDMLRRFNIEFELLNVPFTVLDFGEATKINDAFGLLYGAIKFTWKGNSYRIYQFPTYFDSIDSDSTAFMFGKTMKGLAELDRDLIYFGQSPAPEEKVLVFRGAWVSDNGMRDEISQYTWDDIILPESMKSEIKNSVEGFFSNGKAIAKKIGVRHKRGFMFTGDPGCHAPGTRVVMFDGTYKKVEDVCVGDILMGPDSSKRIVYELFHGTDDMYEITPVKGEAFVVNGHHVLNLEHSGDQHNFPCEFNIHVKDYLELSAMRRSKLKLHRTGVDFVSNNCELSIDPYWLGLWLGDGTDINTTVTSADTEIRDYVYGYAAKIGLKVSPKAQSRNMSIQYALVRPGISGNNCLLDWLRSYSLIDNKHIPFEYLISSREDRLKLLAGIVDSDGHYAKIGGYRREIVESRGWKSYFNLVFVNKQLALDIQSLSRSLGFGCVIKSCVKTIKSLGFSGVYYRLSIFGAINEVPVLLPRKKANAGHPNKDPLRTGIMDIKSLGAGEYYGFNLSGDHLYLTDDYIVHHNSGKTLMAKIIANMMKVRLIYCMSLRGNSMTPDDAIASVYAMAVRNAPCVLLFEDLDSQIDETTRSVFLNTMDGFVPSDGVLTIATTNYPRKIDFALLNRPSRFDCKWAFPYLNEGLREKYLLSRVKRIITLEELPLEALKTIATVAKDTEGHSSAMLQELVVRAAYAFMDNQTVETFCKALTDSVKETTKQMELGKSENIDRAIAPKHKFSGPKCI